MDAYLLFKFLHVASAIVWIGAGFGLVVLGMAAERKNDRAEYGRIIQHVVYMAPKVFIPSSLAVLIFGLIAAYLSWSFTDLWIDVGLIGFASTFITGNFLLRPRADKVAAIMAKDGMTEEALAIGHDLLSISKFDYVMLFVVVADMVFKPTISDWPVLAVMAIALVVAGYFFLTPVLQPRRAVA